MLGILFGCGLSLFQTLSVDRANTHVCFIYVCIYTLKADFRSTLSVSVQQTDVCLAFHFVLFKYVFDSEKHGLSLQKYIFTLFFFLLNVCVFLKNLFCLFWRVTERERGTDREGVFIHWFTALMSTVTVAGLG